MQFRCKALLAKIASKCRSEGIALIIAGQRATVSWIGGADLRANVDIAVLGRFARASEARHATGAEADLPDMGAYGEGAPGVFLVTELGGGGDYDRGRVFLLSEPAAIDAIVAARLGAMRPYVPGAGKAAEAWAKIDGDDGEDQVPEGAHAPPGQGGLAGRIAAARELASQSPRVVQADPDQVAAAIVARRAQFDAQYAADMAADHGTALRAMLAAPGGISTRKAAEALGCSHMAISRQLHKWRAEGLAEVRGRASGRSWHLTSQGTALHAVPDLNNGLADRGNGVIEADAEQVHGPGGISTEQVVMLVAFWALQNGARHAAAIAQDMGMPDAALARALRLAADDPDYVKADARRALLQAGAPVPAWLSEDPPASDVQ